MQSMLLPKTKVRTLDYCEEIKSSVSTLNRYFLFGTQSGYCTMGGNLSAQALYTMALKNGEPPAKQTAGIGIARGTMTPTHCSFAAGDSLRNGSRAARRRINAPLSVADNHRC